LLAHSDGIRFSEHFDGDGAIIFAHACKLGLEGIVSKRRDLPYRLRPVPGMDQTGHPRRLNLAFGCWIESIWGLLVNATLELFQIFPT
jgi:hypothetical protein